MYICGCGKKDRSQHQETVQNTVDAADVEGHNSNNEPDDSGGRQFYCSEDSKTKMARLGWTDT